jgi:orotate phosphoribosyltransferase
MAPAFTELARRVYQTSYITGTFRLRSGAVSNEYFDKYLFESDTLLLTDICRELCRLVPSDTRGLAGLELGGIPLATVMAQMTGLPLFLVRKEPKPYGTCRQVEGGDIVGRHLAVVEDVVTSGGQIVASAEVLKKLGARPSTALCVVDREAGATTTLATLGMEFRSLFTMSQLKAAGTGA